MSSTAQPPIIIDTDDLAMFDSLAAAEAYLEPPDVPDGAPVGFDATGRRILSRIERTSRGGFADRLFGPRERVRLELSPSVPDPAALRVALIQYVNRVREGREQLPLSEAAALPEVLAAAYEFARTR
jgi:hypothetical protein